MKKIILVFLLSFVTLFGFSETIPLEKVLCYIDEVTFLTSSIKYYKENDTFYYDFLIELNYEDTKFEVSINAEDLVNSYAKFIEWKQIAIDNGISNFDKEFPHYIGKSYFEDSTWSNTFIMGGVSMRDGEDYYYGLNVSPYIEVEGENDYLCNIVITFTENWFEFLVNQITKENIISLINENERIKKECEEVSSLFN